MAASLWSHWPALEKRIASADHLTLLLDYDGTLAPIAPRPSKAKLPAGIKRVLRQLLRSPGVWVAVVSGRRLSDLKGMVQLRGPCYVGNHGLELEGAKLRYVNPVARANRPLLRKVARQIKSAVKGIRGAWVEDKGFTLTLHFREVAPQDEQLVHNRFYGVLRPYLEKRQLRMTGGKRVFEVRPPVRWSKGTVVEWLLARRRAMAAGKELPIFVGDDETDEDAFERLENKGVTVAVGPAPLTCAHYAVKEQREVERLLKLILKARRGKDG